MISHSSPAQQIRAKDHFHIPGTAILRADHITVAYENGMALDDISFELNPGEQIAVVGPNGAGKSTLFKLIAGVLKPTSGSIKVYGAEPRGHICIAYIPQRTSVDWSFPVTVSDVVLMGRTGRLGFLRWPTGKDQDIVQHALTTVGLGDFAKRQINQLSGGQQQRMFIARALAQEAELMLLDEPTTGLDAPSQADLFTVLDSLKKNKVTVMMALHDLKLASQRFDRVMLLNHKLLGFGKPGEIFRENLLKRAYGDKIQILTSPRGLEAFEDSCCGEEGHAHA